jgi:hypothetical protein
MTRHAQFERPGRARDEDEEGLSARAAVLEQQLVTADLLEGRAGCRIEAKSAVRKAPTEIGVGEHAHHEALLVARDGCEDGFGAVVAVNRQMIRDQQPPRRPFEHVDGQPQLVPVDRRPAAHLEEPAGMAVDPARAARRHLERRGGVEQRIALFELHEDALAVGAEQTEVAVRGREQAIDADMALRDHRMEHAAHPDGGGERRFVRNQRIARAQDLAVTAQARALLRRQHHVRIRAMEERQRATAVGFDLAPLGSEHGLELCGIELARGEHRSRGEERRRGRAGGARRGRLRGRLRLRQRERALHEREVALRAGRRVVELEPAEETARSVGARCERHRLVLDHRHRVFVLASLARQVLRFGCHRSAVRTRGQSVVRERVGGEVRAARERAEQRPRMTAGDR